LAWTRSLDEAMARYGDDLEVLFASHGWPYWGAADAVDHLRHHRDLYRWIHDEAMRLANTGLTPDEIAAEIDLPPGLWADWTCHGYYGTLSHNVRAVYQRHFGFFDGHPASLDPHPPVEAARRYVEFMGGIDTLVANARRSFEAGDYRWVVEVLRHAVFADPTHTEARALQADACEQLGYQAESGPWRDIYLTGAKELREGTPAMAVPVRPSADTVAGMTPTQIFDYLAVRLDGPAAVSLGHHRFAWVLTDDGTVVQLELSNGTLHSRMAAGPTPPDDVATIVRSSRATLDRLTGAEIGFDEAVAAGQAAIEGDLGVVSAMWGLLTTFTLGFPIIEP
jgi:alkyl sulfatase BDS1-like metallo-beta-lactamase superfamily hydrolase